MNYTRLAAVMALPLALAACLPEQASPPAKNTQAQRAAEAANSIQFTDNAEIDNIKRRIEITSKPGQMGYILLMNEAGQPILYESVVGKVTSGGKRLTSPDRLATAGTGNGGTNMAVRQAASDEGTWGHSGEYIFYWNTDGTYRQWNGKYFYSTQPIRLRIEPLVINVVPEKK